MTLKSLGSWHNAKDEVGKFFFFSPPFYSKRPGSTHSLYRQPEKDGRERRLGKQLFSDSLFLPC